MSKANDKHSVCKNCSETYSIIFQNNRKLIKWSFGTQSGVSIMDFGNKTMEDTIRK